MVRFETITFVYNEEFLLPFYLKHYAFCNRINVIFDMDSTDKTLSILQAAKKINIVPFRFPDMMDDVIKCDYINQIYRGITDAFVINVDVDEFVFMDELPEDPINRVALYNVYRNKKEKDLDINKTVKVQRCHGVLDSTSGRSYVKPIVVRSGMDIAWNPGNHSLKNRPDTDPIIYKGAHWSNADLSFCVDRRVKNRRDRQSAYNLKHKLTFQHHGISEQNVIDECKGHENDPRIW